MSFHFLKSYELKARLSFQLAISMSKWPFYISDKLALNNLIFIRIFYINFINYDKTSNKILKSHW